MQGIGQRFDAHVLVSDSHSDEDDQDRNPDREMLQGQLYVSVGRMIGERPEQLLSDRQGIVGDAQGHDRGVSGDDTEYLPDGYEHAAALVWEP